MLKPNKTRAKLIQLFLLLALIVDLIFIVSCILQLNLLKRAMAGVIVSQSEASANDMRHWIIALVSIPVFIACTITFIMWFRRGYYNLHQRVRGLEFSEGWAAGAWFVPFVNLARPVKIMTEMASETQELLVKEKLMQPSRFLKVIIPIWWTFWILDRFVGGAIQRNQMKNDPQTIAEFITDTNIDLGLTILAVPLTIVTILMVRSYAKMEDLLQLVNAPESERPLSDGGLLDN